jgi:aspartate carbamoyltransferase catalytic subunit
MTNNMSKNTLFNTDVLSMKDLSLSDIELILKTADHLKKHPMKDLLVDKIIANCFFEPSTRTRLSFEAAALRLGGHVIGFASDEGLSVRKGETLHDTIRVVSEYADLIVIRHPKEGAARMAAEISTKPVINAGDGANQHPTQALVDLFTIQECQEKLNGLSIALVGDLKYGRTIHSFVDACKLYDMRLFLVAPDKLSLSETLCDSLRKQGIRFSFHPTLEEVIPKADILYLTRIQQERFSEAEYQLIKKQFILTPAMLETAKPNMKIMHPLPRVNEIDVGVDKSPHAHYFEQAANGIFIRQALLTLLLNETLPATSAG